MGDKALIIGSIAWWLGGILSIADIGFSLIAAGSIHGWMAAYCHLLTFILPLALLATSFFAPPLPRKFKKYYGIGGGADNQTSYQGVNTP